MAAIARFGVIAEVLGFGNLIINVATRKATVVAVVADIVVVVGFFQPSSRSNIIMMRRHSVRSGTVTVTVTITVQDG